MSGDDDRRPDQRTLTATELLGEPAPAKSPVPSPTLARGAALGRYLVVDRLGGGGMGVVYSAYDPELDRTLAVKVLRPEAVSDRSRLQREARAMARLSHPNVIAVHDVGSFAGGVFVAMERVDGVTLSDWLTAAPRDWREIVALFVQAGRGLAAAHAVGLVHRDFKPANVLVGRDGRVRVVDFGLARAVDDASAAALSPSPEGVEASPTSAPLHETITRTGALLGTPTYMAPEMWHGRPADARTDQFSFAVALYRALWNTRPFGDADDLDTIAREVKAGRLRPPPKDSRVPAWLRDVVLRALSVDPAQRWPSMDAMLEAMAHDPAQRRRRILAAGGALAAAVAMAAGARGVALRDERACRAGAERFAGVWDDARRAEVHRAFAATGVPYAEQAFASASRALDAFTAQWRATYTQACEATRVRHDQSDELYDLRMECLQERLQEAKADVELFTRADANVVEKAANAASSLSTSACSDVAALHEPVRPPADATAQTKLAALRERLSRVSAMHSAGKYKDVLPLATQAVADARALGYKPVEAKALWMLGSSQREAGDFKAAESTLQQATVAARAGRATREEVRAWTLLARVAESQAQYDRGQSYLRYAMAALDASGISDERPRAGVLYGMGTIEADRGDYAEALASDERALAMFEKTAVGGDDAQVAMSQEAVGRVLGDLGRYSEQEAHIRRALAIYEKIYGREHPDYASSLFNLAYAQNGQGRLDEALATYRETQAIWERTLGPEHPLLVLVLTNIGDIFERQGKIDEAVASNRQSLALSEKVRGPDHPDTALAAANLGAVLLKQGQTDDALADFQRALAISEKRLSPTHRYIIGSLVGIGQAQVARHQPAAAIAPLERALAICDKSPSPGALRGDAELALANALWDSGRDRARARQLATAARSVFVATRRDNERAEVDAWLAAHR